MITAAIPTRFTQEHHRSMNNITSALWSIHRFAPSVTEIIVVDSCSEEPWLTSLVGMCQAFKIKLFHASEPHPWNKCRLMNAGMKQATTPYLAQIDMDMLFVTELVETALRDMRPDVFLSFKISNLTSEILPCWVTETHQADMQKWTAEHSVVRNRGKSIGGVQVFHRDWFYRVRGYDEGYSLWGKEDEDMLKRAQLSGLTFVHYDAPVYHMPHPSSFKVYDPLGVQRKANEKRYLLNTIVRNDDSWGTLPLKQLV